MTSHLHHEQSSTLDVLDLTNLNLPIDAFSHLRRESFDLYNRLHSIQEDGLFVTQVHAAYSTIPLIPNLRCGTWYCDPAISAPYPAYFKSTDGHTSNWNFNLRRPNLHLLPVISEARGIVLVDSTRAGKRIPDALSRTVPIWCAVVNRAMVLRYPKLRAENSWDTALHTPPLSVSKQEHVQIENLLDGWAEALTKSSYTLTELCKPVRPIWITPSSSSFPQLKDVDFLPVICVSASRYVEEGVDRRTGGFVYVQGSGDDHELWGKGLTPQKYWAHHNLLLSVHRSDIKGTVESVLKMHEDDLRDRNSPSKINKSGAKIQLAALHDILPQMQNTGDLTAYVLISNNANEWPNMQNGQDVDEKGLILRIVSPEGKKGQMHFLQVVLPFSLQFIHSQLSRGVSVCISCPTGNDVSVGVAVAALQQNFDANGKLVLDGGSAQGVADKSTIRTRLQWIISDRPTANPSRNTLKRVNEFLLSSATFRMSSVKRR